MTKVSEDAKINCGYASHKEVILGRSTENRKQERLNDSDEMTERRVLDSFSTQMPVPPLLMDNTNKHKVTKEVSIDLHCLHASTL